ncbi:MAG TPA: nucleotide kinase domain-containing protein [archaeon]|nr:nucleotide kinase domain-containing protein [archaeon]
MVARESFKQDMLDLFWKFVCERQKIWHRRFVEKLPQPWTDDKIMQADEEENSSQEYNVLSLDTFIL